MKVFMTGASGYIGSVIAEKLIAAGHGVVGLTRNKTSVEKLEERGIEPRRGDLHDSEGLMEAARDADAVIHTAFDSSSLDWVVANVSEADAVDALITGVQGSGRTLIFTSGTGVLGDTGTAVFDEDTAIGPSKLPAVRLLQWRLATEDSVLHAAGVRGVVLRPPNVYGRSDGHAMFWMLRRAAEELGAVPYAAGSEDNLWSYVHVDDLADLFVLALEKAPGGHLFHTGAQRGLRTYDIATALSRGMGLGGKTVTLSMPELAEVLGSRPVADYWASNNQSSDEKARRVLGWQPQHLDLLGDVGGTAS